MTSKSGASDLGLLQVLDDLRELKNRMFTVELARLDRDIAKKVEADLARIKGGRLEEQEAIRRKHQEEGDRRKQTLESYFKNLEDGLYTISEVIASVEARRAMSAAASGEASVSESDRAAYAAKMRELDARLAKLDVVERAQELDEREADFNEKMKLYQQEMDQLMRQREELNKDFENLGRMRAQIEKEGEDAKAEVPEQRKETKKREKAAASVLAPDPEELIRKVMGEVEKALRQSMKGS